jgi:hypothetical protein
MSLFAILTDDWSDYDSKKTISGGDAKYFSASEAWEVEYLANKIAKHHPSLQSDKIKHVIGQYSHLQGSSFPRTKFIEGLAEKLHIRKI